MTGNVESQKDQAKNQPGSATGRPSSMPSESSTHTRDKQGAEKWNNMQNILQTLKLQSFNMLLEEVEKADKRSKSPNTDKTMTDANKGTTLIKTYTD